MSRIRRQRGGAGGWALALAGSAVAAGILIWRTRHRFLRARRSASLETALVEALREDPDLSNRPIEVSTVAEGIVELSGRVATEEEAERAVAIAHRVTAVGTVLNRLDVEAIEAHLADNRSRFHAGDPALTETQWHGQSVGTGRRRQGLETDPDRPDDRVAMLTRELGTDRALEQTSERLDKIPPGVEGHTTRPAGPIDRGRVDDASHRRLGNEPEEPLQELNPDAALLRDGKKAERVRPPDLTEERGSPIRLE